jgi:hypothetical protein
MEGYTSPTATGLCFMTMMMMKKKKKVRTCGGEQKSVDDVSKKM